VFPHAARGGIHAKEALMKVTIDIDCTPEEARTFLGLPDVAPLQQRMLGEIEARMRAALEAMDPQQLMASWLAGGAGAMPGMGAAGAGDAPRANAETMTAWQKSFWDQMAALAAAASKK
jgi:hypothetical protein